MTRLPRPQHPSSAATAIAGLAAGVLLLSATAAVAQTAAPSANAPSAGTAAGQSQAPTTPSTGLSRGGVAAPGGSTAGSGARNPARRMVVDSVTGTDGLAEGPAAGAADPRGNTSNSGRYDINVSSESSMRADLGLTPEEARTLREYRDREGGITSAAELRSVQGLSPATRQKLEGQLDFTNPPTDRGTNVSGSNQADERTPYGSAATPRGLAVTAEGGGAVTSGTRDADPDGDVPVSRDASPSTPTNAPGSTANSSERTPAPPAR